MKNRLCVNKYEYFTDKISEAFDGFTFAVLSDLHCCSIGRNNELLIKAVNDINPDVILCTGDMVTNNAKKMGVVIRLFKRLCKKYTVYYAIGNHEAELLENPRSHEKYISYSRALKRLGVIFLDNNSDRIIKDTDYINIYGLNLEKKYYHRIWKKVDLSVGNIKSIFKGCGKDDKLNILLAHNPEYHRLYAGWGADIVLSGHVHGGMVVLPVIGGVISPSYELFPHYDFGKFVENKKSCGCMRASEAEESTMYLSRGLGWHTLPVRLFNPPEMLCITLRRS